MKLINRMVIIIIFMSLVLSGCSQKITKHTIEPKELEHLTGLYTGELNYKDYKLDGNTLVKLIANCYFERDTMNIDITINEKGIVHNKQLKFAFKNGTIFHESESQILNKKIDFEKQIMDLVFIRKGKDDNKNCELKYELQAGISTIIISKYVKYDDADAFFKRNAYTLNRY